MKVKWNDGVYTCIREYVLQLLYRLAADDDWISYFLVMHITISNIMMEFGK